MPKQAEKRFALVGFIVVVLALALGGVVFALYFLQASEIARDLRKELDDADAHRAIRAAPRRVTTIIPR